MNWTQATTDTGHYACAWPQFYAHDGKLYLTSGAVLADSTGYIAGSLIKGIWSTTDGVTWIDENADTVYLLFHNPIVEFNGDVWTLGGSKQDWKNGTDYQKIVWRSTDGVHWRRPVELTLNSPN